MFFFHKRAPAPDAKLFCISVRPYFQKRLYTRDTKGYNDFMIG